jgi:hypothetical protein
MSESSHQSSPTPGNRQACQASVAFIHLPGLFEQQPGICFDAIQELHNQLRNAGFPAGTSILSAFTGAIVVAPDRVFNDAKPREPRAIHHFFKTLFGACRKGGMPVRVGVTHGRVEFFEDVEGGPKTADTADSTLSGALGRQRPTLSPVWKVEAKSRG